MAQDLSMLIRFSSGPVEHDLGSLFVPIRTLDTLNAMAM